MAFPIYLVRTSGTGRLVAFRKKREAEAFTAALGLQILDGACLYSSAREALTMFCEQADEALDKAYAKQRKTRDEDDDRIFDPDDDDDDDDSALAVDAERYISDKAVSVKRTPPALAKAQRFAGRPPRKWKKKKRRYKKMQNPLGYLSREDVREKFGLARTNNCKILEQAGLLHVSMNKGVGGRIYYRAEEVERLTEEHVNTVLRAHWKEKFAERRKTRAA